MKFRTTPAFDREFRQLPPVHRKKFLAMVHQDFLPAVDAGAFSGTPPWPRRLRVHKVRGCEAFSITWSFASPDGRATFHVEADSSGEPELIWRRIGDHSIYKDP